MNFAAWLGGSDDLLDTPTDQAAVRAAAAWRRISDKPTSVVFTVPGSVAADGTVTPAADLAAQTVRLETDDRATMLLGDAGAAPVMQLIIFGIRGHATLPDTNMVEGYRFRHAGDNYRIDDIILTIGEIQGVAVAVA